MKKLEINLNLKIRIPEQGLRVNGILQGLEEQTPIILTMILKSIFMAIEQRVIERLSKEEPGRYVLNGHQRKPRKLITQFGVFYYRMAQIVDKKTGKTIIPLSRELGIEPYRQYQAGVMEAGVGLAIHLSFARASSEVLRIKGQGPSKSTLYRWFREISFLYGRWPPMKSIPYRFLMVDGTEVRLQGTGGIDLGKKEMRWALASLGPGKPFEPVGFWIDRKWDEIRKELEDRLDYSKLEVLFSDGGPGIEQNLLAEGMRHQRCLWHGKRDFPFILYMEGLKKAEQQPFKSLFGNIPIFDFTKERLEKISPADYGKIQALIQQTKEGFEKLINEVDAGKYPKARAYLINLYNHTMTFLDYWLETKQWIPLNINAIESAFSRIANRIKRVGKRWSDKGLIAWLMLAFRKIFKPDLWDQLWKQYLKINKKIELLTCKANYVWLS